MEMTNDELEQALTTTKNQIETLSTKLDAIQAELDKRHAEAEILEFDRWRVAPNNCYWLFTKKKDFIHSVICGYKITRVNENDPRFIIVTRTVYTLECSVPVIDIRSDLVTVEQLIQNRKDYTVYAVDPADYYAVTVGLLNLGVCSIENMQELEDKTVAVQALYQVE